MSSATELAVLRILAAQCEWGYASVPYLGRSRVLWGSVYATKEAAVEADEGSICPVFVLRQSLGSPLVWLVTDEEIEALGPCPNL